MIISLDKDTHAYFVDGDIAQTSVTAMLHDQGLAPDLSGVSKAVLNAKADAGTKFHEEMERIVNGGEPESDYGRQFKDWFDTHVQTAIAEKAFAYRKNGYTICGRVDLHGTLKGTLEPFIVDYKFTSKCPKDYVTWQTSVYDAMIDGTYKNWGEAHLYCLHFNKGKMTVVELEHKPMSEVQKLLDCECNGDYYLAPTLATQDENLPQQWESAELALCALQAQIKAQEEQVKAFRQKMCDEMQKQGIVNYNGKHVRIAYVAAHTTDRVDTARLKAEYPDVYAECLKTTTTKASVRVTVKDNGTNQD